MTIKKSMFFMIASFGLGYGASTLTQGMNSKIVFLKKPLLTGDNGKEVCVLPVGTPLHFVRALPEGGDAYQVYLYYKGTPLETENHRFEWSTTGISVFEK